MLLAAILHLRHDWTPVMLAVTLLDPSLPAMLSRRETCKQGGFGLSTLKLLLADQTLRQVRVRNRSLIPKAELERYLSRLLGESGGRPDDDSRHN
jgi:excisionase family DNA binding protein